MTKLAQFATWLFLLPLNIIVFIIDACTGWNLRGRLFGERS